MKTSLLVAISYSALLIAIFAPARAVAQATKASAKAKNTPSNAQSKKRAAAQRPSLDKVKVESHVRRLNMWGPEVKIRVGDPQPSVIAGLFEVGIHADAGRGIRLDDKWYVSADGQALLRASLIRVQNDLFQEALDKLDTGDQPWFGDQNGLVTVVVFSDFQCPFCRSESLMLREKIPATYPKDVRVVFADFPLEGLHPWSRPAAITGRCVYRQDAKKFWDYHDWVFRQQGEITAENFLSKFKSFAGTSLDIAQIERCAKDEKTAREIDAAVARGRALRVASLPTVFVNGRSLESPSWERLEEVINYELEYKKKAQQACDCGLPGNPAKKN